MRRWARTMATVAVATAVVPTLLAPATVQAGSATRAAPTIAPSAQCHGPRCFVIVRFSVAAATDATVSVGTIERRLRLTSGRSTRVVEFGRSALLDRSVVARAAGTKVTRRVTPAAFTVNTPAARCATLAPTDVYLSVGPTNAFDAGISRPSRGTLHAAMIFIDFPDAVGTGDPRPAAAAWVADGVRHLGRSSYGRFSVSVDATTTGFVRLPGNAASYDPFTYDGHRAYIQAAIDAADAQIDFTGIDQVLIVPTANAAISGSQAFRGLADSLSTDEGPLQSGVTYGSSVVGADGVVFSHEIAHTIGLPDLYDPTGTGDALIPYTGMWDFMGMAWIDPTDLFAWQRSKLGWLDESQTLCARPSGATFARLQPLSTRGGVKAVFVRTGTYTGVVVENRQRSGNDTSVCRPGVLVYRVDSRVKTLEGPIRVAGGSTTGPGCGIGPRSDATLRIGESRTVGGATVSVLGSAGRVLEVSVVVD